MATKRLPTLDGDDNIPVEFLPDVTTAPIAAHTAATDPHGDRAFATSAIATHTAATDPHGDRSFATSAIATHTADTTAVHGIADTTLLETTSGAQAKATAAQTAAAGTAAAFALVFGA